MSMNNTRTVEIDGVEYQYSDNKEVVTINGLPYEVGTLNDPMPDDILQPFLPVSPESNAVPIS